MEEVRSRDGLKTNSFIRLRKFSTVRGPLVEVKTTWATWGFPLRITTGMARAVSEGTAGNCVYAGTPTDERTRTTQKPRPWPLGTQELRRDFRINRAHCIGPIATLSG